MSTDAFELVELTRSDDLYLLPWLDLYETAFPPNERVLISAQLKLLREKAQGGADRIAMLAIVDAEHALKGIVEYELFPDAGVVYLWYFAVQAGERGKGLGSRVYRQMLGRFDPAKYRVLLFEVEKPELAHGEEERELSERRIAFYNRLGARLMKGVDYMQHVGGHQPLTPMHIMVHALRRIEPEEAFELAKAVFEDAIQQAGTIELD